MKKSNRNAYAIFAWILVFSMMTIGCTNSLQGNMQLDTHGQGKTQEEEVQIERSPSAAAAKETAQTSFAPSPYAQSYTPMDIDFTYPSYDFKADTEDFDGQAFNAAQEYAKARMTVLTVWSTTCSVCVRMMPIWEELSRDYAGSGVNFVGICGDAQDRESEAYELAAQIAQSEGLSYRQLITNDTAMEKILSNVMYLPTVFFLDSQGNTISSFLVGYADKESMVNVIETMLAHIG